MVPWYWIFFSYRLYFNTCCFHHRFMVL